MTRVGLGYDVHRLATGRALVLGGVDIPWSQGLEGHSDADVVIHAIMDALLGAAGLGDIGVHFPPADEAWRDARSLDLLAIVRDLLPADWNIENIDATILAEQPKIGPYRAAMSQAIAGALGIGADRVNIKATTNERLGFIGRGEGIAALASVALSPPQPEAHE
ncbi:MAG TPA: 2-C-methyl-D-erythritol 2,4-cyclodiphosphate synthase [Nitrolancea sp.]|nr:2-C-methyl-D-erythritol 2,4-cyclodiphosphate synthase [Nitrolancea sp.]